MSVEIINQLKELQEDSGKRLKMSTIHAIKNAASGSNSRKLVSMKIVHNGKWVAKPNNGPESLLDAKNTQSIHKIMSLNQGMEGNFTNLLNTDLLGGENYPILTAVVGTVVGLATAGGGLLFTAATTGLSLAQTCHRVLARGGDEIWQVQEIGKTRSKGRYKAVYISSFFLVDPFRRSSHNGMSNQKGWLIHEDREDLSFN